MFTENPPIDVDSFTPPQPPDTQGRRFRALAEEYGGNVRKAAEQCGPMQGDFAICSQGYLGLITSNDPVKVVYPDGTSAMAWTGINLSPGTEGAPWSSRYPKVVASRRSILKGIDGVSVAVLGMIRGELMVSQETLDARDELGDTRKIADPDYVMTEGSHGPGFIPRSALPPSYNGVAAGRVSNGISTDDPRRCSSDPLDQLRANHEIG